MHRRIDILDGRYSEIIEPRSRERERESERVRGFPESAGAADGRRHRLGPGRRLRRTKGIALMAVVVVVEVERGGGLLGVVELHGGGGDDQWMQWRQVAIERSIRRQIHGRQTEAER